mmetsp:Transcript_9296/g.42328  ORF Transcript_9296/g.42328 Transcript_9296/m.42328 type:complete len:573 (-) Transcript_9296:1185-2903(-)
MDTAATITKNPTTNVCDYIVQELYSNNIDTYFVVTGGSIVPLIDAVSRHPEAKYFCFQHEQGAAMAAEGYFRACGRTAAVCVTSGPGVQNIFNGVCGCWYDSVPALFFSGQVSTTEDLANFTSKPRQAGFQEMPVVDIFSHVCKLCVHVERSENLPLALTQLLNALRTPRFGPVMLDLPVNIQMSSMQFPGVPLRGVPNALNEKKHDITNFIAESRRPLLIYGHGVRLSDSVAEALAFAEKLNLPFVTTWGALDICRSDHPLRVGTIGVYGDRWANIAVQNADLLIVVGARLDTRQIGGNVAHFSKFSKKVMVDVDIHEIEKLEEKGIVIHHKICSDAREFFEGVAVCNREISRSTWHDHINSCREALLEESSRDGDSTAYDIMKDFFSKLPEDAIIVTDIGSNMVWTIQSANLVGTQRLFSNFGNASMGIALPMAIGAAIATSRRVYVVAGDGGLQMNIQELQTVRTYNLPIHITVLDNGGYAMIKQFQDNYFGSKYVATCKSDIYGGSLDFSAVAQAYGIPHFEHVLIPETQRIYPKLEFGNSLENMTPLIDVRCHMLVDPSTPKKPGWI